MASENLTTPDFGGATDVTVIEILVKPGDNITVDSPVATLESDKATMDLPAQKPGVVKELKVKVGDVIKTGDVILTFETEKDEPATSTSKKVEKKSLDKKEQAEKEKAPAESQPEIVQEEVEEETSDEVLEGDIETSSDIHAGPGVRRLARELGVNLAALTGTGPKDRIIKEDVQQYVKQQLTQAGSRELTAATNLPSIDFAKFGLVETKPLSRIKKLTGKNLQRNWMMIPHVTQFGEADITSLEDFRLKQKAELEAQQIKLTPLVFVMKAVVAALKAFPQFNASIEANGEALIMKKYFHIGVAVDTPEGLVVPVIRDVDKKGLIELAKELATLSEKARKKQLLPAEMQGGCFSISSLGGIGGTAFTPIINYPEVAILGVSKASMKPIYQDETFVPRLMLPLSLSYDHRVVDGAEGARFLVYLSQMLSDIRNLLL